MRKKLIERICHCGPFLPGLSDRQEQVVYNATVSGLELSLTHELDLLAARWRLIHASGPFYEVKTIGNGTNGEVLQDDEEKKK